jgi:PAS domain S-box-containing protein
MTQPIQQDPPQTQLAAIVAASQDAIISLRTDLVVQTWNAAAERMFGYGEAEACGRKLGELIIPDVYKDESAAILAAVLNGETVLKEVLRRHKDGHFIPVEINASPILDLSGRVIGSSVIYRDISDRRHAEEAQALLAAIVKSSADAIIGKTLDGFVTSWNEAADRMFGYPAREMIGQSIKRLIPADRQLEEDVILTRLARSEYIEQYETTLVAKDGRTFEASITISPVRDARGSVIGCSKIIRDITERKRAEARIAEYQAQLAAFVEQTPAAIAMFDTDMTYLAASRRFITDYRVENVRVVGVSHYEIFPETPQRWRDVHGRVLAGEELSADEDNFLRLDGRIDRCRWSMKPWRTPDGRIGGALLFSELITEQIEGRRALAASEARFRATFENAAVGIGHFTLDGRMLRFNNTMSRILGWPRDELATKRFQEFTHPDDLAFELVHWEQLCDGKVNSYSVDKRILRKDGKIVWILRTVSSVRTNDGSVDYLLAVIEDIAARKRAEEKLHKSEERFRSSLLRSPLPVLMYNDREQILAVSQSLLEKTGYSREELRRMEDWTTRAYGERSDEVLEWFRRIIAKEPEAQSTELTIQTKDGRKRLWNFVVSALGVQSDGRRLFVCMAHDSTEQKAYEEQILFLMREVNHRAKNMLSLVQAIARQTAAHEPEDFIDHFTERIQALAANQDLLVRNEWRGVDMEDLVHAQLAHFADLVGPRITVDGPKLHLDAAAAQAIGLALHELATNAGKYGALSTDVGSVDVRWRLDGGIFKMSWTESNGPPVRRPERQGFGSTVINSMTKRTVGGEVELDYAHSGLVWRLTCQSGNVLERIS